MFSLSELDEQVRRGVTKASLTDWDLSSEDFDLYQAILNDFEESLMKIKIKISSLRIELEVIDYKLDNF